MGDKASSFNILKGYKVNVSEIRNVKWNMERRLWKSEEARGWFEEGWLDGPGTAQQSVWSGAEPTTRKDSLTDGNLWTFLITERIENWNIKGNWGGLCMRCWFRIPTGGGAGADASCHSRGWVHVIVKAKAERSPFRYKSIWFITLQDMEISVLYAAGLSRIEMFRKCQ